MTNTDSTTPQDMGSSELDSLIPRMFTEYNLGHISSVLFLEEVQKHLTKQQIQLLERLLEQKIYYISGGQEAVPADIISAEIAKLKGK